MNAFHERHQLLTRRHFFGRMAAGIGTAALGSILNPRLFASEADPITAALGKPHFRPAAKRIIYLFMAGGPSQLDLYDYKPGMEKLHDTDLPDSIRMGQRLTGMTSGQKRFPVVKSLFKFAQHGKCGTWFSELIPNIASLADDI